jgi:NTP pyrophosphatase (non-canonical NTP hydrolase)
MPSRKSSKKISDAHITLSDLRQMMVTFVAERDWHKFHTPRNLAASISVEAGELLEHFQWLTAAQAKKKLHSNPEFRHAVGEEMVDVLMYVISLANALDLDLAQAIFAKMDKNRKKYPAETYRGWYERPLRTSR